MAVAVVGRKENRSQTHCERGYTPPPPPPPMLSYSSEQSTRLEQRVRQGKASLVVGDVGQ